MKCKDCKCWEDLSPGIGWCPYRKEIVCEDDEHYECKLFDIMYFIIERLKTRWYIAWLVTIYTFIFGLMHLIHPMSIEVASAVGIAVCHMGFLFTIFVFFFGILDYIITKHKSKHE